MAGLSPKLVFVIFFLINVILFTQNVHQDSSSASRGSVAKRFVQELTADSTALGTLEDQCSPRHHPISKQCSNVRDQCKESDTFIGIQYLATYYCADISVQPLAFTGLLLWLLFLFSTLGISASEFFTPNLGTIASLLGLDESVAGVTFLAFGNGSPDVFSTFSAMRAGSGSLAIGELLGAASFIVSCVVGSICIIRPFAVNRGPFLRDVGFFTFAVSLLFAALWDNKIALWEAICLLILYLVYVTVVVVGSWWDSRLAKVRSLEETIRSEYQDDASSATYSAPYHDDVSTENLHLVIPSQARNRTQSNPPPPTSPTTIRPRAMSHSARTDQQVALPSFSLIGALEFRHVVSSFQPDATGHSLSAFEHSVSPYAGGHYHTTRPRSRPRTPASGQDVNPFDAVGVQLYERSLRPVSSSTTLATSVGDPLEEHTPSTPEDVSPVSHHYLSRPGNPLLSAASSDVLADTESQLSVSPLIKPRGFMHILQTTFHILFPSLHSFGDKSILGQIASVFAAPAIVALTLTLPVVVTRYDQPLVPEKKKPDSNLAGFEEEDGRSRDLFAEELEEPSDMVFNKWLMGAQCTLGPLFCVTVLTAGTIYHMWSMIIVAIFGVVVGSLVLVFAEEGNHPASVMARCFMGFIVAIVWIMAIADEVVQVLQTFGLIFGLSDALIGLTIFAVGNSLADLVANMSVAAFAPMMGFAACFGGPMLNILIGVGGSTVYILSHEHGSHYDLKFTTTLFVSSIGLLFLLVITMIVVPLNGYYLTRKWGIFLVFSYLIIMTLNVVVEVKS